MATTISYSSAKSWVVSLLTASRTPWATTPDGSNAQYNSATEINTAILQSDFEIATLIANTAGHPYQAQFIASPTTISGNTGVSPIRNGMVVEVQGQVGASATTTFLSTDISTSTDLVTKANHGLVTGQQVQVSTSVTLPTGLVAATTYYIYTASSSTYGFCTTVYNAKLGTLIDITGQGSGTNTVTTQYSEIFEADSKDSVIEAINSPYLFATSQGNVGGYWFIEANKYYCTCPNSKIYYTDTVLSSSPQSPEPMLFAVVAGAVSKLLKDGSDANEITFYTQQYQQYLASVQNGMRMLPEIQSYQPQVALT